MYFFMMKITKTENLFRDIKKNLVNHILHKSKICIKSKLYIALGIKILLNIK